MTASPEQAAEELRLACVETRERLVDAVATRGFEPISNATGTWRGKVTVHHGARPATTTAIDVRIPKDYPFVQPKVDPLSRAAAETWLEREAPDYYEPSWSWHRERNGHLCLFEQADHTRVPWADAGQLFDQIEAWLREDAAGWPGDAPQLDVERYLKRTHELLIAADPRTLTGRVVAVGRSKHGQALRLGRPLTTPKGRRGARAPWPSRSALVLDIGELALPIRNWTTLIAAAGGQAPLLEREVHNGVRDVVLAYARGREHGVLGLRVESAESGWDVKAHYMALEDVTTLTRRAHASHEDLSTKRVTIVGLGAVGAVLADLLHRSGIGHLRLIDPEVLLPGNAIRHLCGPDLAGFPKAQAVKASLTRARPWSTTTIESVDESVDTIDGAVAELSSCDLVVDATADSTASRLLAMAARAGAGRAVSVCVLADGYAIRTDHWPEPLSGGLEAPVLPPQTPGTYETGCSSPVSTTPPAAVWEAAALGARHAIQALLAPDAVRPEERRLQPAAPDD